MDILVPKHLDFTRQVIEHTPAFAPPVDGEPEVDEKAQDVKQREEEGQRQRQANAESGDVGHKAIYGSVTNADVAAIIRQRLSTNDEASQVVIEDADVVFVNVRDESGRIGMTDRVKHVGDFRIEINIRGAEAPIGRVVRISAL